MQQFPKKLKHDSGVPMTLEEHRVVIEFVENTSEDDISAVLGDVGLELEKPDAVSDRPRYAIEHTATCKWLKSRGDEKLPDDFVDNVLKKHRSRIQWIGPVYRIEDVEAQGGLVSPLPHVLVIRLAENLAEKDRKAFDRAIDKLGLEENPEKSRYLEPFRYFRLKDPAQATVYAIRGRVSGLDNVQEVFFENLPMVSDYTATPNDTFYTRQWDMRQIRAGGAGTTGWDVTTGDPSIVIAVVDTGCDLTHPDIVYAGAGFNANTGVANGTHTGNAHGTACAGLAAAVYNSASGVAGVAGSCRVLPVNRNNSSDVNTAIAIRWSADNGARVVSMSFGRYAPGEGFGPTGWNFALIDPAIAYAVNTRKCVLVAASGNENTNTVNRYPARHPLVICVGASDQADNRKSPTSPDGETWGANFGLQIYNGVVTGVSVVAPGVQTPTTDILGAGGYNLNGGPVNAGGVNYPVGGDVAGNYFFWFNGTSSATPHVAGLAALILSLNGTLSPQQVRDVIEQTAAKVGAVAYLPNASFPNGTWNQQMGYGRIDVLGALNATPRKVRFKEILDGKRHAKEFIKEKEFLKLEVKEFAKESPKEFTKEAPKEHLKDSPKEFKEKDFKDIREDGKFNEGFDPIPIDPRLIEMGLRNIQDRLAQVEQTIGEGEAFVQPSERPAVGERLAKSKAQRDT